MKWKREDDRLRVDLANGTCVCFTMESDRVIGFGDISVDGVPLRRGDIPFYPSIKSLSGVDYREFLLEDVLQDGSSLIVRTTAVGRPGLESPYGDQYNGHLIMVSEDSGEVRDQLDWIIAPDSIDLDGNRYVGFSYAWRFESVTQKIHCITAHTTLEIGGSAAGNTILSQGQVTPPVYIAEKGTHFTSACLQSLQRFGDPTGMSFQLCPRWGLHQCFDFLSHDRGTLLGFWREKHDTRSFVQKNPGEDAFFVIDAEHWRATCSVATTPKSIVFCPASDGSLRAHEARNRWKDAYDHCTEAVRGLFGIRRSTPMPERTLPYGQRLNANGTFDMKVGDEWVRSQEWLIALADRFLPAIAKHGIKRVITEPIVETDPTQRGLLCKLGASGLHGDLNVGSVCCVHRYRPAEFFGGMKAWAYFCEKAHNLRMEVGHWVGPHLSYNAPILTEHPDWYLRAFSTLVAAGGYPNFELACMNWNTPVRQWVFDDLKRMREEGGLDYIWFDSFGNLGLYPVDYSREMETNTFAIMEFIADVQGIGVSTIAIEGMSPVGVSGAGVMDYEAGHDGGVQGIAGQNSWRWYDGNEDMMCDQQPRPWVHRDRTEEEIRQRLFRCLANHCAPETGPYSKPTDKPTPWFADYCRSYVALEKNMVRRVVLPDEQGIEWTGGEWRLLFSYGDFRYRLPPGVSRVELVRDGKAEEVRAVGELAAQAGMIYRMK